MSNINTFHTSPDIDRESLLIDRFSVKQHLCALLLFSLILKLFLLGQIEVITNDGPRYINLAIQLTHGDFWAAVKGDITFVYSLVIAALGFFFSDLVLVARMVSLTASVLTIIPLYLLFHDIWNKRIAFLSCSFFVILPCFNEYAVEVMRDPLFLFTFASMMLFAWRALNGMTVYAFWCFSIAIISPFLRLESFLFLPFLVLFSLYNSFTERRRQALYTTVLIVALLGLLFYAFQSYNFTELHYSLKRYSDGLQNIRLWQYSPDVKKALRAFEEGFSAMGNENSLPKIVSDNIRLIYFIGLVLMFIKQITWAGFLLLCLGMSGFDRKGSKGSLYLVGIAVFFMAAAFDYNLRSNFMNERYIYVPVLAVLPWIGSGMEKLLSGSGRLMTYLGYGTLVFCLVLPIVKTVKAGLAPQPVSARLAGEWLGQRSDLAGVQLLSNERKIPFYAGRGKNFKSLEFKPITVLVKKALQPGEKLVTLLVRAKDKTEVPPLKDYVNIAEFNDDKYVSLIYHKKE